MTNDIVSSERKLTVNEKLAEAYGVGNSPLHHLYVRIAKDLCTGRQEETFRSMRGSGHYVFSVLDENRPSVGFGGAVGVHENGEILVVWREAPRRSEIGTVLEPDPILEINLCTRETGEWILGLGERVGRGYVVTLQEVSATRTSEMMFLGKLLQAIAAFFSGTQPTFYWESREDGY